MLACLAGTRLTVVSRSQAVPAKGEARQDCCVRTELLGEEGKVGPPVQLLLSPLPRHAQGLGKEKPRQRVKSKPFKSTQSSETEGPGPVAGSFVHVPQPTPLRVLHGSRAGCTGCSRQRTHCVALTAAR